LAQSFTLRFACRDSHGRVMGLIIAGFASILGLQVTDLTHHVLGVVEMSADHLVQQVARP
jgi:hypothetical protein